MIDYIYALCDPNTDEIRYVGKSHNPQDRLRSHLISSRFQKDHTHKSIWLRSLMRKNEIPKTIILERVEDDWQEAEVYWIALCRSWGCNLTNGDNGGLGTNRLPNSVKNKIRNSLSGRSYPEKWKAIAKYDFEGNLLEIFPSIKLAAKAIGIVAGSNIRQSIKYNQTSGGFLWAYLINDKPLEKIPTKFVNGKVALTKERLAFLVAQAKRIHTGRKASIETKHKQSLARLGKSPVNKGISMPEEQKILLRTIAPRAKKVFQFTMNGIFIKEWSSMKFASQSFNIPRASILSVCKGLRKHAGGFLWSRTDKIIIQ